MKYAPRLQMVKGVTAIFKSELMLVPRKTVLQYSLLMAQ
jgi:hypothetical protein